jgi:hypothetical protein
LKIHSLHFAAALTVVFASTSMADIQGSTYNFSTGVGGSTQISAPSNGAYTDPANPGFCVGPPVSCGSGSGLSGQFAFADTSATTSTITFTFFGSTSGAGPGDFFVDLGNFALLGGDTITGVSYASGSLGGATSNVSFNGTTADFKWSTGGDYDAVGGNSVVFDVTEAPSAVPEPSSIWLMGTIAAGLLVTVKKLRHA